MAGRPTNAQVKNGKRVSLLYLQVRRLQVVVDDAEALQILQREAELLTQPPDPIYG